MLNKSFFKLTFFFPSGMLSFALLCYRQRLNIQVCFVCDHILYLPSERQIWGVLLFVWTGSGLRLREFPSFPCSVMHVLTSNWQACVFRGRYFSSWSLDGCSADGSRWNIKMVGPYMHPRYCYTDCELQGQDIKLYILDDREARDK